MIQSQTNKHNNPESTPLHSELFPHRTTTRGFIESGHNSDFPAYFRISQILSSGFLPSGQGVPLWVARNESINGRHRPAPNSAIVICTFRTPVCVCVCVFVYVFACICVFICVFQDESHLRLCSSYHRHLPPSRTVPSSIGQLDTPASRDLEECSLILIPNDK